MRREGSIFFWSFNLHDSSWILNNLISSFWGFNRWQSLPDVHVICLNEWYVSLYPSDNHNHLNPTLGPPTWSIPHLAFSATLWAGNHRSRALPLSELPRQPHAPLQHSVVMAPCLRQQWHAVWELSLPHSDCVMSARFSNSPEEIRHSNSDFTKHYTEIG